MCVARGCALLGAGLLAISVAGCEPDGRSSFATWLAGPEFAAPTATVQEPGDIKYFPSDEPLKLGLEHFDRGIARFDLADRAYGVAIGLTGETTQMLNNLGYSYMLRGDLVNARKKFLKAYEREPNNPTIANNLKLLNSSSRFIQRVPDPRGTTPE
jgi:hypothetical protein